MKNPNACYECGKMNPRPDTTKQIKVCDDPSKPEICYFVDVKIHSGCQ